MWDAIKNWYMHTDLEFLVADILLIAAIVYYVPKGIIWWFRTNESDVPPLEHDRDKPRKPQDYL